MRTVDALVSAHLDAWNTPAGPGRTRSISSVYSADVVVAEPQRTLRGHEGMEQAIDALHAQLPGTTISRSGPVQVAHDLATYAWTLGTPDGPALATGRDVLIIRDDDVVSLYVVIDAPPPPPPERPST